MTTFYLDPIDGNDANDGTTFANRWKTVNSGATAARTAPGDTIRIIASPAPVDTGLQATWTRSSATLTISQAVTASITECESIWTASTNVTATADSSAEVDGTNCAKLAIGAAFTTGKVAYFDLGSNQNLSGYQQVSLWLNTSVAAAAGVFELKLCSDATGDTAVDTLALPETLTAGLWQPCTIDKGAALGSAIRSVALYATSDIGAVNVYLDHIIACKAASAADCITLMTLLGKNAGTAEPWLPIRAISGTTIYFLAGSPYWTITYPPRSQKYYGTSETRALYTREPFVVEVPSEPQESGTDAAPIIYSGGWNRTDMSTRTDVTWLRRKSPRSVFHNTNNVGYIEFENLYAVPGGANSGWYANQGGPWTLRACGVVCSGYGLRAYASGILILEDVPYLIGCNNGVLGYGGETLTVHKIGRIWGNESVQALNSYGIDGNSEVGTHQALEIGEIIDVMYGINGYTPGSIHGCTFESITSTDITNYRGSLLLVDCKLSAGVTTYNGAELRCHNYNQVAGSHRTYYSSHGRIETATDQRHTASGVSWKFTFTATRTRLRGMVCKVATIFVRAGVTVTAKLWCRRSNTGFGLAFECRGKQVAGVPDLVQATMTAAADTWEQLSLSFTATEDGVVDLEARAWSSSTAYYGWIDDLTVQG